MRVPYRKEAGFTLIEMLVCIAIMGILLSVIFFSQSKTASRLVMRTFLEDLSLRITQARSYGVGVRESAPGSGNFDVSYGFSFYSDHILYFLDQDGDHTYDGNDQCSVGTPECIEEIHLPTETLGKGAGAKDASGNTIPATYNKVDVTFTRPSTEAVIKFFYLGNEVLVPNVAYIEVGYIRFNPFETKNLRIYTTGQISIP